jgi:hypothetical protein
MFDSRVVDHVFIGGVMGSMFDSRVVDHVFIGDEHMIYNT